MTTTFVGNPISWKTVLFDFLHHDLDHMSFLSDQATSSCENISADSLRNKCLFRLCFQVMFVKDNKAIINVYIVFIISVFYLCKVHEILHIIG